MTQDKKRVIIRALNRRGDLKNRDGKPRTFRVNVHKRVSDVLNRLSQKMPTSMFYLRWRGRVVDDESVTIESILERDSRFRRKRRPDDILRYEEIPLAGKLDGEAV